MRRRALLSTVGSAAVLSTAGCLDAIGARLDEPMQLGRFTASNSDSDPHTFDLRVNRDGETVHRSSHRIRGMDDGVIHGAATDCDWGTARGNYEVFARVDGGNWTRKPLTDVTDDWRNTVDCATAQAWYEGGDLWLRLRDDCEKLSKGYFRGECPGRNATDG
jgi:hypothetical protein